MADALAIPIVRAVVRAAGPDAATFLQGQLSQDVAGLAHGRSAWSLLLAPQGKVEAWLRVTRVADDEFELDTDAGFGTAVVDRLDRFRLRTKCELTTADEPFTAVRGADDEAVGAPPAAARPVLWPGVSGFDLPGRVAVPGAVEATMAEYEALRVAAGVPAMGAELTERTIPAEVGDWFIAASVSFTKGCYTGQELVARIDSRGGNVPRHLRGVEITAGVPVGAELRGDGGKVVGAITSVAGERALAYVGRAVEPPADVVVTWPGGESTARVEVLPDP